MLKADRPGVREAGSASHHSHASTVQRLTAGVLLLATALWVPGCATISEEECLQGDWQLRGYRDGQVGKPIDTIARYAEDCQKHGIEPDAIAYSEGLNTGLREYCLSVTGFDEGKRNADYSGACPVELEADFLEGYIRGLELAREDLYLAAELLQRDLDASRDERARADDDEDTSALDDDIEYLNNRLSSNSADRQAINRKIERWSRRL